MENIKKSTIKVSGPRVQTFCIEKDSYSLIWANDHLSIMGIRLSWPL